MIVESGSSKPELQAKAAEIFYICRVKNLNLETTWISWDFISKLIDYDEWIVKNSAFKFITKIGLN